MHPLEHGRIEVQYKPGTPKATVTQLEALLAEQQDGYHMLLFQNTTGCSAKSPPPRGRTRSPARR